MTSTPFAFATIHTRDDLTVATRERRKALGMNQLEIDDRAGLPDGYTGKLEAALSNPSGRNARAIGWTSVPLLMGALGLELVAAPQGSPGKRCTRTERARRGGKARSARHRTTQRDRQEGGGGEVGEEERFGPRLTAAMVTRWSPASVRGLYRRPKFDLSA